MAIYYGDGSNSGAGRIIQVQSANTTSAFTYNSTSWGNVGLSYSITPKDSSSKILVMFNLNVGSNNNGNGILFKIQRDGSDEFIGDASGSRSRCSAQTSTANHQDARGCHITFVSSPSTTSSITYQLQAKMQVAGGSYAYFGTEGANSDNAIAGRFPQSITLMEIAA